MRGGADPILLDGFKRYRCARALHLHVVPFASCGRDEVTGILQLLRASRPHALHLLEEARFVDELHHVRGLDIADAEFMNPSLTWLSLTGTNAPSHAYNRGMEWLRGFYGGLVVSCGPLNTGGPFSEDGHDYGLHGTHSHSRAIVESVVNPDPRTGRLEMSISGLVRTARVFGPNVELHRTIRRSNFSPRRFKKYLFTKNSFYGRIFPGKYR